MEFNCNHDIWIIKEIDKDTITKMYNDERNTECTFVFGCTRRSDHHIFINKDMCFSQKISTLKHELTHCYIWEYGLYNADPFNEEVVCDLVSASNDFINGVVERYKKEYKV